MADIIFGAIVIIVTAFLAEKAPPNWRKWLWALFVVLVIIQAGVQIRARLADRKKADDSETAFKSKLDALQSKLEGTQGALDTSLRNEGTMEGRLTLISDIMSNSHIPGVVEIASALRGEIEESKAGENQLLVDRSHVISRRLGQAWSDNEHRYNSIHAKRHTETQAQKDQVAKEDAATLRDYEIALDPIIDEAKFVRSLILLKLRNETDEDKQWDRTFAEESPARVASGLDVYMQGLAKRLSPLEGSPK